MSVLTIQYISDMIRNKDFALLYAGRAVFNKNGEYAGVVVGWNDMLGVILGVDHGDSWQTWSLTDISVSEEEFLSYEYRNAGTLVERRAGQLSRARLVRCGAGHRSG